MSLKMTIFAVHCMYGCPSKTLGCVIQDECHEWCLLVDLRFKVLKVGLNPYLP